MTASPRPLVFPPHAFSTEGRKTVSQTNKMFQDVRIPWTLPMLQAADVLTTGLPTLGSIGAVTTTDPDAAGSWDDSAAVASKFTSDLADVLDAGAADIVLIPAAEAALDKFVMGFDTASGPPIGITIEYSTAGIGGTGQWVYLNKYGNWVPFTYVVDPTAGLAAPAAAFSVAWDLPDDFVPMIETEISATAERYYVAFEVLTVYATNPVGTQALGYCLAAGKVASAWHAPSKGVITHLSYVATAGDLDLPTVLQVLNWTKKTRGLVALGTNVAGQRAAFTKPLYIEPGDEITIQAVQTEGSDDIDNFLGLILEYKI